MPKYLFEGHYNHEGAKALASEGGSGRRDAVRKTVEGLGGKLEALYFAFGDVDAYVIVELPDNVSAAAVSLAVNQTGVVSIKSVVLMTPEEMDAARTKAVDYRPPGG
ncbi:MAG: GYD domain-containing protein [Hyphomicrobiales bacterium]|nr:GYD domain-containing protein [Hyphomicrobiales bacterium]